MSDDTPVPAVPADVRAMARALGISSAIVGSATVEAGDQPHLWVVEWDEVIKDPDGHPMVDEQRSLVLQHNRVTLYIERVA